MAEQRTGWLVAVLAALLGSAVVTQAADAPLDAPALAGDLLRMELEKLAFYRVVSGSTKKDLGSVCDLKSEEFKKIFAEIKDCAAVKPSEFTNLVQKLEAKGDGQSLYLLAAVVKRERRREENPGVAADDLTRKILLESLEAFSEQDGAVILPVDLGRKVLQALRHVDPQAQRAERPGLTGQSLKEFVVKNPLLPGFWAEEILKIAGGVEFSAALQLDEYPQSQSQRAIAELERWIPARKPGPLPVAPASVAEKAPAPRMRFSQVPPSCGGGGAAAGGGHGPGVAGGPVGQVEMPGLFTPDVFEDGVPEAIQKAGGRKSLSMTIGQVLRDGASGQTFFVGGSLCQASVVKQTENEPRTVVFADPDPEKSICRYVVPSADHCFTRLSNRDVIRLEGFDAPIDAAHRRLVSNPGSDFATLLVDAPCNSRVKEEVVAPPRALNPQGGQLVVLDVQQTGRKRIGGRTEGGSQDPNRVNFSIAGTGRIFPGDSGGGLSLVAPSGKSYFAGVLSTKNVGPQFRDAVGTVAAVPDWFYQGLNGSFYQPFDNAVALTHAAMGHSGALLAGITH